ncbi:hypothetical protein ABZ726_01565 [Streptomyces hundungensis]|uniref:hypothetical protein n=1 Tax=Streptomyces hundungensis TaxID=1077946 RepID=UPI0034038EA2
MTRQTTAPIEYTSMTMPNSPESNEPFRCEVAWHAHTDERRGPTCRPDSALHPEPDDVMPANTDR